VRRAGQSLSKLSTLSVHNVRRPRPAALIGLGVLILGYAWTGPRLRPVERPAHFRHAGNIQINALSPRTAPPNPAARPFVLRASAADRARAENCLAQAIYFEAGDQSDQGQAAVAQTVVNRVRHPDFPKSICGVVYQGASLTTGCQYSFTCDGSLRRKPDAGGWSRALAGARRALSGYVEPSVGWATHYHADYVTPYWESRLIKLIQIGAHIFYRWPGPAGAPGAFSGRYGGHEEDLPPAILTEGDPPALLAEPVQPAQLRTVSLSLGGKSETYTVNDPGQTGGPFQRSGSLTPSRPHPTPAQIAEIDALLSAGSPQAAPQASAGALAPQRPDGRSRPSARRMSAGDPPVRHNPTPSLSRSPPSPGHFHRLGLKVRRKVLRRSG
jgi:hypothetical protein